MITREQIADLRAGDIVEVHFTADEITIRGVVRPDLLGGGLRLGLWPFGGSPLSSPNATLTVISRAKPPLYVNSDKTEPDPGDVVRDADSEADFRSWNWTCDSSESYEGWYTADGLHRKLSQLPARLRLLVDGRSGQVVP